VCWFQNKCERFPSRGPVTSCERSPPHDSISPPPPPLLLPPRVNTSQLISTVVPSSTPSRLFTSTSLERLRGSRRGTSAFLPHIIPPSPSRTASMTCATSVPVAIAADSHRCFSTPAVTTVTKSLSSHPPGGSRAPRISLPPPLVNARTTKPSLMSNLSPTCASPVGPQHGRSWGRTDLPSSSKEKHVVEFNLEQQLNLRLPPILSPMQPCSYSEVCHKLRSLKNLIIAIELLHLYSF